MYDCTVRKSTCSQSIHVANVARNLWSQNVSGLSFARFATALQQSRKFNFSLQPEVGKTRGQSPCLAFAAFSLAISDSGMGISRSL